MRYIRYFCLLSLGIAASCDFFNREINIEIPEHDSKIVVNAVIEEGGEEIRLAITRSISMKDSSSFSRPLPDPYIVITLNGQAHTDFTLDSAGHYVLPASIRSGDQLNLEVQAADMDPAFSETVIPAAPVIRDVRVGGTIYDFGGWEKREISFVVTDIPEEDTYYKVSFVRETAYDYHSPVINIDSPITWLNPVLGGLAFTDAVFKDGEAIITIWVDEPLLSRISDQTVNYLKVETLEKAYYDYQTTFYTHFYNQQPDLFGGEPVPMVNNIRGGFGLFSSSAQVKVRLERNLPVSP